MCLPFSVEYILLLLFALVILITQTLSKRYKFFLQVIISLLKAQFKSIFLIPGIATFCVGTQREPSFYYYVATQLLSFLQKVLNTWVKQICPAGRSVPNHWTLVAMFKKFRFPKCVCIRQVCQFVGPPDGELAKDLARLRNHQADVIMIFCKVIVEVAVLYVLVPFYVRTYDEGVHNLPYGTKYNCLMLILNSLMSPIVTQLLSRVNLN